MKMIPNNFGLPDTYDSFIHNRHRDYFLFYVTVYPYPTIFGNSKNFSHFYFLFE